MANWFVNFGDGSTAGYYAVAQWVASHTYAAGAIVRQLATPSVGSERCFRTAAGGTSGSAEPAWVLTAGAASPTDGTITDWHEVTGQSAYGWNAPHARLNNAFASGWGAAGDTFFVGDNHAETQASALTVSPPGTGVMSSVYCVDHTITSPGTGNLKTTGTISTSGANAITIQGRAYFYGLTFAAGVGSASGMAFNAGSNQGRLVFEACQLKLATTGGSAFLIGNTGSEPILDLINTTLSFGNAADNVGVCGQVTWRNTPSAIQGTMPNTLFSNQNFYQAGRIECHGVDFSGLSGTLVGGQSYGTNYAFEDCAFASGLTIMGTDGDFPGARVDVVRSDNAATDYQAQRYTYHGTQLIDTALVRTGGASNGTTAFSGKISTSSAATWLVPFEALPVATWNAVTGSAVNVTLCGIWNAAALPNNDDVWIDVDYLGSASTPLASLARSTKANNLATGTALAADTSAWDSLITARANSASYTVGQVIKVADNAGRVFFCTAAGTSAASEPAGYASAVDGGSVTDGGATFRAGVRFKLNVALSSPTPQLAGDLYAYVKAARTSSTFWIDPLITLS